MASIFAKIQRQAEKAGIVPYTTQARKWFLRKVRTISNVTPQRILTDDKLVKRQQPLIGRMFMFLYEPKGKDTLPFYDEFPLILMVGPAENGFYGLNLHYLSPKIRAIFFDRLSSLLNNSKMDHTTRFKLSYDMLSSASKLRAFAPCFKHYLYAHVKSTPVEVLPAEWEIALFLPSDSFVGERNTKIWNMNRNII
jgi:hypothetical protein